MSTCPRGLCDGSGEIARFVQYVGGEAIERDSCPCVSPKECADCAEAAASGGAFCSAHGVVDVEPEPVAPLPVEETENERTWAKVADTEAVHEVFVHERKAAQSREETARLALAEAKRDALKTGPRPARKP